jgi:hypothetical protein
MSKATAGDAAKAKSKKVSKRPKVDTEPSSGSGEQQLTLHASRATIVAARHALAMC